MSKRYAWAIAVVALACSTAGHAQQSYPVRPVRLLVNVQPGGAADYIARVMGQKLGDVLGQVFVIDNRTGGSGMAAAVYVSKAAADGHTLLLASVGTHGIRPSMYKKLPFDPINEHTPIGLYGSMPLILVVNAQLPVKSVAELVALSQSRPGGMSFASGGTGGAPHLLGELFKMVTGAKIEHIPYKGSAPAAADLAGGQIQMAFDAVAPQLPHLKSGRTRVLAVTTPTRMAIAPDAPTMIELGYPQINGSVWYGLAAPTGTPRAIIQRLNAESNRLLATQEIKDRFSSVGIDAAGGTPEQFGTFIKDEIAKWGTVVKAAGIIPE